VLPFANLSGDPGQDYLSDGLAEALIDVLSRINDLQVTAQTSSFSFKGRPATVGEIARTLNVGAVAEGTLRRQGDRLRIDAHLSDARTGFTIWSRSYDRAAGDLLRLQDEIAGDIAEAMQVKLVDTNTAGVSLGGTANPQAYDAYLRGEQHYRAVGDMGAAYTEFRKAVALDPNFALAQGELAAAYFLSGGGLAPDEKSALAMEAEARHAVDRAIALAPGLGRPHAQRAIMLRNDLADLAAAWAEAVRARALSPGDADVQRLYALIARAVGRPDEAVRAARRAV
jgi:TolB-like protein